MCGIWKHLLLSCTCYDGFGLNYIWYKTKKCWYFFSSSSFVWDFMDVLSMLCKLWYLLLLLFRQCFSLDKLWTSTTKLSGSSRKSKNKTMNRLYKNTPLSRVMSLQKPHKILWFIWILWSINIQKTIYITTPG